jgi:protein TilB
MGRITEELLRKRAEHNEGILSTMEEVSLHQFDIEKIENLDKLCRHLKILYLQNNIIEKLENLEKLKELEYLNLAVNSVSIIENLEGCESLKKLDLTLNFIDIEDLAISIKNLSQVYSLSELFLTGNPCEKFQYFKEYVIASLPQVTILNGNEILKSERIKALQMLPFIEKELERCSQENIFNKENDPNKDDPNRYTKEYRRKLYKELEEEKIEKEKLRNKKSDNNWEDDLPKGPPGVYKENGEIRICNQGKYDIYLDEDIFNSGIMTFEIKLPKHMDTSKIELDLNPQYVRVVANGKVSQWKFEHEILVEKAKIQRSSTTGHLLIKAPIVGYEHKQAKYKEELKSKVTNTNSTTITSSCNKKVLKPLKEDLNLNKVNNIDIVHEIDSRLDQKFKSDRDDVINLSEVADIDINEIPDLE